MLRRGPLIIGGSAVTVAVVLVLANTAHSPVLGGSVVASTATGGSTHHVTAPRLVSGRIPTWVDVMVGTAFLAFLILLLTYLVWSRWSALPDPHRRRPIEVQDDSEVAWDSFVRAELSRAAHDELFAIERGSPRNAVVACWVHLQDQAAQAGLNTRPEETSQEYAVRAETRLRLPHHDLERLAVLYREARFSEHVIGERSRSEARHALNGLVASLDESVSLNA